MRAQNTADEESRRVPVVIRAPAAFRAVRRRLFSARGAGRRRRSRIFRRTAGRRNSGALSAGICG